MKSLKLLFFLSLVAIASSAQNSLPYLQKTVSANTLKIIEVKTSGGSIKLLGNSGNKLDVKVFVKSSNGKDISQKEIEALIENYDFDVKFSMDKLLCIAKSKTNQNHKNLLFNFEISTPKNVDIDLKTSGGSINIENLNGNLVFATSGGSLNLKNLNGNTTGRTSGGSIYLADTKGNTTLITSGGSIEALNTEGNLELKTSGGSLTLTNLSGKIEASTSGGSIYSENIEGSLEIKTSGGSIDLINISGDVWATTSGGGIKGNFTKLGKELSLKTSAGNINVNLPFNEGMDLDLKANKIKSEKLAKVSPNLGKGEIRGKVNGGGTLVTMRTGVGNITID
jgi:hypothetical protein